MDKDFHRISTTKRKKFSQKLGHYLIFITKIPFSIGGDELKGRFKFLSLGESTKGDYFFLLLKKVV